MAPSRQRHCCRRRRTASYCYRSRNSPETTSLCFRVLASMQTSCVRPNVLSWAIRPTTFRKLVARHYKPVRYQLRFAIYRPALKSSFYYIAGIAIAGIAVAVVVAVATTADYLDGSVREIVKGNLRAIIRPRLPCHPCDCCEVNCGFVCRFRLSIEVTRIISQAHRRAMDTWRLRNGMNVRDMLTGKEDCVCMWKLEY